MAGDSGPGGLNGASGWGLELDLRQWAILGGISLLALILLAFCGGILVGDDAPTPTDSDGPSRGTPVAAESPSATGTAAGAGPTSIATATPRSEPASRSTRVGNVDLEVVGVLHPYDATRHAGLNTANVRIDLEATASGDGGGYFTAFELALMDDAGIEHGAASCLDCPGNFDSLELGDGEMGAGSAYFELPEGREPAELIYRGSASGEEGRISLGGR